MTNEAHSAAPGWYPSPDGSMRYWDGSQWLDLPAPPQPHAGPPRWKSLIRKPITWGIAALLAVVAVAGIAWKVSHDAEIEAQVAAAEAAASAAAQREADRIAAEKAEEERRAEAERSMRRVSVTQIEASIKQMAEKHANSSIIDGPILSVSCSPVGGGSIDDLTEMTTIFECFAATKDNGDGTMSGYKYHATMNWSTGSFTYGFGAP
ncbi:Protein of unknown function DUF2510 [Rhodococcus rhodochrous ATCC 21198]|uniref:DUF2510 domain-containing protein n=1 Tax=Rhodococcus TaxID=1827 RepID=UPI0003E26673|nr:DUF2510 domain-containing protein [Rhodococcus aetherivorans]ETT25691.1 Protein of unknown function DUF2510 [Rhodococcus rhodochrous ATCC 21198]NCL73407.1 hypothetical protein [Rhodococcus sp. YH1]NGP26234.1 DUF2510 domain-containing protein [Rhodococcus aetherivorans]